MTRTYRDRVIPPAPRRPRRPGAAAVLLAVWTLFILYGTLLPFDFSAPGSKSRRNGRRCGPTRSPPPRSST